MADAGLTDHGLKTLWDHFDELVDAITDPDTLAEKACEVELIHPESKRMLESFPADAKTKTRSLLQSIEGKIKDQPVYFHVFLAVLKTLPGLANLGGTLLKTYDDKVTSRVSDSANPDCVGCSTVITESNSCVRQDEAVAPQQEDNGRSGGSGDSAEERLRGHPPAVADRSVSDLVISRVSGQAHREKGEAMTVYNENKIKALFSSLLVNVRRALEAHSIDIKDVRQFLGSFFGTDDCFREAACVEQIFTAVSINHLWDYENYGPVEALAKGLLPKDAVERLMRDYKSNFSGYFTAIKVLDYIEKRNVQPDDLEEEPSPFRKLSLKQYRKIKVVLQLERKVSELSLAYVHGLWVSFAEEYELPSLTAIIDEIVEGSLTITWLVLGHVASMIKPKSRFFKRHQIILVSIDDVILYDEKTMPGYEEQLLLLCAEGKADISQFSDILNRGIDPDIHDQFGKHPLWYAVYHRRADLVHLLLENKADVDLITINGDFAESALTRAYTCINGYEEIANILVKKSADVKKIVYGFKILRKHFDELVDAITDPDVLAEEAFVRAKRPLEKSAEEEAAEKRPRLEGKHSETSIVDSHSANVAIDSNPIAHEKRPLEKLAEEAVEKHPRLEGEHSETSVVDSHSANVAIDNNPLLKHRPKLAAFYSHQPEVPEGTWPPVKKIQYINLALIRAEQPIDFSKEFLRQTIRGSIDDIMKDKYDIKYDEVFAEVEEGARLLFEGRPGCGKTTMMNKASQDWAKWKIFSSYLFFLVHLQRFGNRSDINLETVLRSTPVEFSDEEFRELLAHIESNQGKGIVFALDGLDEYCPENKKTTFIHRLIKGEVLPQSIVIVASRPAASQRYRRNATNCIEVLGFLKGQVYEYINSYFDGNKNKDSLVVGLQTYLEHHPNIMHMCYLPLHTAMVTYLYDEASLPQTETEVYRHFTLSTLLRSIRKRNYTEMEIDDEEEFCFSSFDDLKPEDRGIFDSILKFAYEATVVNPQQVFSAEEVKKFTNRQFNVTGNNENSLGLVVVDKYFVRYGLKEIYTFLHLTFQEFLSACHIVQLDSQAQEEIILKHGSNKSLGVVWKFYCGMTQFSNEKMRNFELLVEKTKSEVLFHLCCAHESQQDILCTHIINSYDSKIVLNSLSLNPADFTALGYVLTHSNVPATELAITSCNIGPEGLSALEKAVNVSPTPTLKTLSFHATKVKKVIPKLCSVMTKFRELHNLNFSSCGIIKRSLSEMAEMLPALELVEQLDLSFNNDLGVKSADALRSLFTKLPKLKHLVWIDGLLTSSLFDTLIRNNIGINLVVSKSSKSPKQELFRFGNVYPGIYFDSSYFQAHPSSAVFIQALNLYNKSMDDTDAQSLAICLPHCTNLQQLNLRHSDISDAGAQALAEGLQHCSNLKILDLGHNDISDAGAQALAEGLQHCSNLLMLDLMKNKIGNTGAQALAEYLQHCTDLKELFLYGNNIDGAGIEALVEHLPNCTNPQNLDLRDKDIGDAGAQSLAEGLQYYTDIQKLDLKHNGFGIAGARALAEGLQHCTNLQELDLSENDIEHAGAQALAECLQHCTHLQKLNLSWNKIEDTGAQVLAKGLQHCTNLQKLNLSWNKIEDAGAQDLAEGLQHYTNLQKLNLNGNNIGTVGAQALAKGLQHCTNLQELNLSWNKIEDAGAQALAEGLQHYTNLQVLERNIKNDAHGREVERQDYGQEDNEVIEKCLEAKGVFSWKSADSLAQEPEEKPQLPGACVWKLPGVEECDETSVVVHSSQGQHVEWNGLKLHIHAGSLPEGLQQCTIFIKASLAGEYEIPENTSLVSGIFWLRCEPKCIFTKPVTVEIQHCSTQQDLSKLVIVRAFCNQKSLPYKFNPLGGRFDADTFYGAVDMKGFSGVGIVDENSERMYYSQLFYRNYFSHQQRHEVHIIFVWNTELHLNHVSQKFPEDKFIAGCHRVIKIKGKKIQVVLEEAKWTRVMDDQWEILPAEPTVTKAALDKFEPGRGIPSCVLEVRPLREDFPQLVHQIILKGIKSPHHKVLLSYLPPKINRDAHLPAEDGVKRTRVFLYPAGRVQLKHLNLIKWTDERGETQRFYLMKRISSKWREIGELIGLLDPTLTSIATEHCREPLKCCRAVLGHWLENPPAEYPLTWKKLIELLKDSELGQVASDLQSVLSKTKFE